MTTAVATLAAMALVAGCGGSDVQDATAQAADPVALDVAGAPATGTAADATVPGAAAPAADTTGDTTTAAAPAAGGGGGAAGSSTAAVAGAAGKTGRSGTSGAASGAASGTGGGAGGSAVEKLVATHPIFGGTAACKPATLSPVNIGNVTTLSGVLGELFSPVRPALETFVASQNACGGLNGHKINFFMDDDQGDPSTASSKVQEMVQSKKVLAFVGNIQVLTVDAIAPIIKRLGVPIIGADLTNNTWFTNPLMFPQGPGPQAVAYGYVLGATTYHKTKNVGNIWCIEVPRACEQINRAYKEMAAELGAVNKKDVQVSITAPSYVQQCLEFKNAGVEALAMTFDAASQNRLARSCEQVGFFPKVMPYPLGVGNEKQFFGNKWLGDAYVPMNHFPWNGNTTPAEKYWQASIKKYNPGFVSGGAASLGWGSAALLVAASAGLSAENPTTQQLLETLWTFKGQKFTELGGLTGPLVYQKDGLPKIPYCLFANISNKENTGWAKTVSKPTCTKVVAPSDPQNNA